MMMILKKKINFFINKYFDQKKTIIVEKIPQIRISDDLLILVLKFTDSDGQIYIQAPLFIE